MPNDDVVDGLAAPAQTSVNRWRELLWAACVGGAALVVYVRTVAPGLIGIIDTPMFQFVGRVLGVAHNPGYPLYTLLTYPVSLLPVGTLAFRINLFSAVAGAVAVALTFLVARRLGCGIAASLAGALGLAFGRVFWSQAIIAEVYTLNAALIAASLWLVLTWGVTEHPRYFFGSLAVLALGLGNHTTILSLAPGIAAYAFLTHRRFATRPRTIVTALAVVSAGFLQYVFVLARSRQPGTYVESPARTLGALFDVIRGAQFADRLFTFGWRAVLFERVPLMVGQVLVPELTAAGLLLALVGAILLLRRRPASALLLLTGGGVVFLFVLNYAVIDSPVFLIPTILVLWLCVAVALDDLVQRARHFGAALATAAVCASLLLPGWCLIANFTVNDLSRATQDQVYFDRLFETLPSRTVFVREDFVIDRMVNYELLGEGAARGREILLAPADATQIRRLASAGFAVFAFPKATARLRLDGLDFSYAPLALTGERLTDFVAHLPDHTLVALAVPAALVGRFAGVGAQKLDLIGASRGWSIAWNQSNLVVVGARGSRRGALVHVSDQPLAVDVPTRNTDPSVGFTAPAGVQIRADTVEAAIRMGDRDLLRTSRGIALATFTPTGEVRGTYVISLDRDSRVPILSNPYSVHRLRGELERFPLPQSWTDSTRAVQSGNFTVRANPGAGLTLYVGADAPFAAREVDQSPGQARIGITPCGDDERRTLTARLRSEGVAGAGIGEDATIVRMDVSVPPGEAAPVSIVFALGAIPRHAVARSSSSDLSELFRVNTDELLWTVDRDTEQLAMSRDEQSDLIGGGWSKVEYDGVTPYRWMEQTVAQVLLPIHAAHPSSLTVQAFAAENAGALNLHLRINGTDLPAQGLRTGWASYEWVPPVGLLHQGVNELAFLVSTSATKWNGRTAAVTTISVSRHDP